MDSLGVDTVKLYSLAVNLVGVLSYSMTKLYGWAVKWKCISGCDDTWLKTFALI